MQAIARVNRVLKDKRGGLVVDYLGFADELKEALSTYTESGGTGQTAIDQSEASTSRRRRLRPCWSRRRSCRRVGQPPDPVSIVAAG